MQNGGCPGLKDFYDILGVSKTSSDQEIKSAYRKLALKHHPDRNAGDKAAEEKFKEAAEAYSVLADNDKRARYDRFGHAGVSGSAGAGPQGFDPSMYTEFQDSFGGLGDIFGFGGGGRRGGPQRGSDLRYDLEIKFEQAAKGVLRMSVAETARRRGFWDRKNCHPAVGDVGRGSDP